MPSVSSIAYYLFHLGELRNIIQWKVWHNPPHERDEEKESADLRECFRLLNLTSRSFAAVIQELHADLLVPVTLFYLILRGLDTVEDDMTIKLAEKEPLLRDFYHKLDDVKWNYDGNGPDEKDRELLVKFEVVGREFAKVKEEYRVIIKDITKRMGKGMADYVTDAEHNQQGVQTVADYEMYCHYVAGLVGEGLTRLFVEAKLANPVLLQRPELMESMGQFLQQTNIIRDIREDHDDKRYFWPKEIWSKYVSHLPDIFLPENREKALQCQSEMVLLALQNADNCLFYMAGIREQSIFNFVAIPQSMAIATLELCFQNYTMFEKNVKITKGAACGLMTRSTQNLQIVTEVFREYARKIHKKNVPSDPSFLDISIACAGIERFIESIFPTQTGRTLAVNGGAGAGDAVKSETPEQEAERKKVENENMWDLIYIWGAVLGTLFIIMAMMVSSYSQHFQTREARSLRDTNVNHSSDWRGISVRASIWLSRRSGVVSSALKMLQRRSLVRSRTAMANYSECGSALHNTTRRSVWKDGVSRRLYSADFCVRCRILTPLSCAITFIDTACLRQERKKPSRTFMPCS